MAVTFALNTTGATWRVQLVDCVNDTPFDETMIDTVTMIFYKPDGTILSKDATLENDGGIFYITYVNDLPLNDPEIILDLIGKWEYSGAAILNSPNGANTQSSQRAVFWVL